MENMLREDRKVLIILLILSLGLIVYLEFNNRAHSKELKDDSSTTVIRDTIYLRSENGIETDSLPPIDTLPIVTNRYPGPPQRIGYPKKLQKGSTIDLNSADTLMLMRVPGIGESFARRIARYRELLGGYYVVEQLQEVYGMDRERYDMIAPYFQISTPVEPLVISRDSIPRHPYLQWRHVRVLQELLRSGKDITWQQLMASNEFSRDDSLRLAPYLVFSEISQN